MYNHSIEIINVSSELVNYKRINKSMKIAIIGSARSRSTLLVEIIKFQNLNIPCYYEYYTYTNPLLKQLPDLTTKLFSKDNFIIKILGHNLKNNEVSVLNLERYDQLHLIERHNFFSQCCSLQVAADTKIWLSFNNLAKYQPIKSKKYHLQSNLINWMAQDIANYLKIKQFLNQKNISYKLYDYDSIFSEKVSNTVLQDPKLNYKQIIHNYDLHDQINTVFNKYFSYDSCLHNVEDFTLEVNQIIK